MLGGQVGRLEAGVGGSVGQPQVGFLVSVVLGALVGLGVGVGRGVRAGVGLLVCWGVGLLVGLLVC